MTLSNMQLRATTTMSKLSEMISRALFGADADPCGAQATRLAVRPNKTPAKDCRESTNAASLAAFGTVKYKTTKANLRKLQHLLWRVTAVSASLGILSLHCDYAFAQANHPDNLLGNPGFEDFPLADYGNHIPGPVSPWIIAVGQRPNVVKVDGPGGFDYRSFGPESDASGRPAGVDQYYLDVTDGSNTFYQTFTTPNCSAQGALLSYRIGASFSSRDNRAGVSNFQIFEGAGISGASVPGSLNTVNIPAGSSQTDPWLSRESTVNLRPGTTYSFAIFLNDFANADETYVILNSASCPAISVVKSTPSVPRGIGDTLIYRFAVENRSVPAEPVNNVVVSDMKCAAPPTLVSATVTLDNILQPDEVQTYECTSIPVTAAEISAGVVDNSVTVTGNPPVGALDPVTVAISTPVVPRTIVANNDTVSGINGIVGNPSVLNVFTGDTIDGVSATVINTVLTVAAGSSVPSQLTFDAATGIVGVNPGTAPGTYSFNYQICEVVNPTNCRTAIASVTVAPSIDLVVTKSNGTSAVVSGDSTTYTLTVTNNGPDAAVGPVVTDTPGAGITCPVANPVTISGSGVPAGSFTIANLTGAGITLGTLASGQSATLSYSCQVN